MRRGVLALVGIAAAVGAWAVLREPAPDGRWFPRTHRFDRSLTDAQRAEIEQLEAIGYLGGTLPPGERAAGVFVHEPDAWTGPRFYVSGEGPVAHLIDATGTVLHTWRGDFWAHFPSYPVSWWHGSTDNWRRARLLDDGSVVAIHEGLGMVRLDARSALIWANPGRHHHDLHVRGDEIVALAREARIHPAIDADRPVLEDRVVWLRLADGVEIRSVSVYDALRKSRFFRSLPARSARRDGDLLHTNAVWVLDGTLDNPAFAAGNVLLSFRETSTLAVLDPRTERVVWTSTGSWSKQHDPQPDGLGRILLFDNVGGRSGA
ncbi:MAG: aryl-sulfate sulfotransferase, partial [Deltaproteobacteria bacterium]|nr:aryl-sulfate sulfotransferase [Deltaproteobacteria bacterium]